jgi:hypothetical protein
MWAEQGDYFVEWNRSHAAWQWWVFGRNRSVILATGTATTADEAKAAADDVVRKFKDVDYVGDSGPCWPGLLRQPDSATER